MLFIKNEFFEIYLNHLKTRFLGIALSRVHFLGKAYIFEIGLKIFFSIPNLAHFKKMSYHVI